MSFPFPLQSMAIETNMTCWKFPHWVRWFHQKTSTLIGVPAMFDLLYYTCPSPMVYDGMVPPFPQKYLPFACNLQYLRVTASHLHPICSVWQPYATYIRPTCCPYTCLFSTWYTYVQAIAYHSVSILLFISCLWLMYCQYYIHTWNPYNTL